MQWPLLSEWGNVVESQMGYIYRAFVIFSQQMWSLLFLNGRSKKSGNVTYGKQQNSWLPHVHARFMASWHLVVVYWVLQQDAPLMEALLAVDISPTSLNLGAYVVFIVDELCMWIPNARMFNSIWHLVLGTCWHLLWSSNYHVAFIVFVSLFCLCRFHLMLWSWR